LFPIPLGVKKMIEKLQRDFLWGGLNEEFKFHLVKWSQLSSPLQFVGLEIWNLSKFNQVLLGEWLWLFARKREAFWRLVVEAKYDCMNGGRCTKEVKEPFGVGVWKPIRRGWGVFTRSLSFEVGNGSHIRFWHDIWFGDQSLKEAFPELFHIARCKEAWVMDNMQVSNGFIQWNVPFFTSCLGLGGRGGDGFFFGMLYVLKQQLGGGLYLVDSFKAEEV
jgi:hypothetical protein